MSGAQMQAMGQQSQIPTQEQANGLLGPAPEGLTQSAFMPNKFLMEQLGAAMSGKNPYDLAGGGAAVYGFQPGYTAKKKAKADASNPVPAGLLNNYSDLLSGSGV